MPALPRARLLLFLSLGLALVAAIFFGYQAASDSGAPVVSDSSAKTGWKTIEYEGVRVDIPETWERLDDCEGPWEQWGPSDTAECGSGGVVYLAPAATYDPARRPGVERTDLDGVRDGWGGYVYAGDLAVYVSHSERGLVDRLLGSARGTEN